MTIRETQLPAEVGVTPDNANLRVTQLPAEVGVTPDTASLRTTQIPAEVGVTPDTAILRVSQLALEVLLFEITQGSLDKTLDDVTLESDATFQVIVYGSLDKTLDDVTLEAEARFFSNPLIFCRCRRITAIGIGRRKL